MILGADKAVTAAAGVVEPQHVSSTAHLFAHQGLPTRIVALTIRGKARKVYASSSSSSGAMCDIQGFRVEYMQVGWFEFELVWGKFGQKTHTVKLSKISHYHSAEQAST
jgi:hypothetical protein